MACSVLMRSFLLIIEWQCATVLHFISLYLENGCALPFIVAGSVFISVYDGLTCYVVKDVDTRKEVFVWGSLGNETQKECTWESLK